MKIKYFFEKAKKEEVKLGRETKKGRKFAPLVLNQLPNILSKKHAILLVGKKGWRLNPPPLKSPV